MTKRFPLVCAPQGRGWSKLKIAAAFGMPENSVRRLLDLHHRSQMWIIDEAIGEDERRTVH